ncbi:MAG TPA: SDR family oxidoreductase [Alphaproteobacteria bacterium]|nr:SDR family oxidoreductase [Alphaproteobacteria bacterium]
MLDHRNPTPTPPKRVVILGARGIIGRALVRHLESEALPVLALGSAEVDLLDPAAAERLGARLHADDALVVLAALTPDKGRDIATLMKNLRMGEAVAAALAGRACDQVLYVSSDAVYPMGPALITESTPANPSDLYGVMHKTREVMMASAVKPERLAVLRATMVLAAHDTHGSYGANRFRRQARESGKITLSGRGEETRDQIYLDDLTALMRMMLLRRSHGLLNAASGVSLNFLEVARLVAAQFAPAPEIVFTPRTQPITHRHFDITALRRAFPTFRMTAHADAIARVHRAEGL